MYCVLYDWKMVDWVLNGVNTADALNSVTMDGRLVLHDALFAPICNTVQHAHIIHHTCPAHLLSNV